MTINKKPKNSRPLKWKERKERYLCGLISAIENNYCITQIVYRYSQMSNTSLCTTNVH